jgi:polysaccharide biosynthesis protein PelG
MAGIGFKLQRLLVEEVYLSQFKVFSYALIITSGPWLVMIVSLYTLWLLSTFLTEAPLISEQGWRLFYILLVYIYFLTAVITGVFQLFFTRLFADRVYFKERSELPNVITTNLLLTFAVLTLCAVPFVWLLPAGFLVKVLAFSLFLITNTIWVFFNYISSSDDFLGFIQHFVIGSALSFALGTGLGFWFHDFWGMLLGFTLGQLYIALSLFIKSCEIFGLPGKLYFAEIRAHRRYNILLLSGFFLYAGIWVDKVIFWYSPSGRALHGSILHYHPAYNDMFYLAFLFSTPMIAVFFIMMETSFYRKYYAYNKAVLHKGTLTTLQRYRIGIIESIRRSLINIVRVQGLIIVLGILFSRKILVLLQQSPHLDLLFSIMLPGVFCHMLILKICVLLLYFDIKEETVQIYAAFFVLNEGLTLLTLFLGEAYRGLGYTLAGLIVLMYALRQLRFCLQHLNYLTFTRQAMPGYIRTKDIYVSETGRYGRYYLKDGKQLIKSE